MEGFSLSLHKSTDVLPLINIYFNQKDRSRRAIKSHDSIERVCMLMLRDVNAFNTSIICRRKASFIETTVNCWTIFFRCFEIELTNAFKKVKQSVLESIIYLQIVVKLLLTIGISSSIVCKKLFVASRLKGAHIQLLQDEYFHHRLRLIGRRRDDF